jgi:hypothetical protein
LDFDYIFHFASVFDFKVWTLTETWTLSLTSTFNLSLTIILTWLWLQFWLFFFCFELWLWLQLWPRTLTLTWTRDWIWTSTFGTWNISLTLSQTFTEILSSTLYALVIGIYGLGTSICTFVVWLQLRLWLWSRTLFCTLTQLCS